MYVDLYSFYAIFFNEIIFVVSTEGTMSNVPFDLINYLLSGVQGSGILHIIEWNDSMFFLL